MAAGDLPDGLDRAQHVELAHRARQVWGRRALIAALAAIPVVALMNVFGQQDSNTAAVAPAATLTVRAPDRLRGGLLYQTVFTIVAHRRIESLDLVLSPGWLDGLTLNTVEPAASQETSRDGRVSLSYGKLDPGRKVVVFADWQVNPTTVTHRGVDADVYDGANLLAHVHRTLTVFP